MSFLVPIDVSAPSQAAIELAVTLGRVSGEEAILLHVSEGRPPLDLLGALYEVSAPLREAGITARLRTVQGQAAEQIMREAERRHCRWVVMGTRGHLESPASVAAKVMTGCRVPVMAVRPGSRRAEYTSVCLHSRPRSQAPRTWDLAGLLAAGSNTQLVHTPHQSFCKNERGVCSEDSLLVLDIKHTADPDIHQTLSEEKCSVLLVACPEMGQIAQPSV